MTLEGGSLMKSNKWFERKEDVSPLLLSSICPSRRIVGRGVKKKERKSEFNKKRTVFPFLPPPFYLTGLQPCSSILCRTLARTQQGLLHPPKKKTPKNLSSFYPRRQKRKGGGRSWMFFPPPLHPPSLSPPTHPLKLMADSD